MTSAYELARLGRPSLVLEADDQVGGLARTVRYGDYRFDIGGHRFFSKSPLINELWQEILGEDLLQRRRLSRIYYGGQFYDYPLKALQTLSRLGPVESLLVGLSYLRARVASPSEEANFEQWVSRRFGHRLYRIFFKTYTEKVWGIPCAEISADWAAQRIRNLSLAEALRNSLLGSRRDRNGQMITSLIDSFAYPRLGPGMMWERCEELLGQRGSETIRGVRVERLRHRDGRVEALYGLSTSGKWLEVTGSDFISTMPLRDLIQALDPAPPAAVVDAAKGLQYRDYLTIVLIVNRPDVFPDNWIYVHSPEVKLGRIQNYKNWSPEMVPDGSRTALGLEYFLWDADEEWSWSDDRLVALGIRECEQLGLIRASEVERGTVARIKKAYPLYDRSYQGHVSTVRAYLATFANLQTIGRNGLHRYNNQDHSMLTGIYAARNILEPRYDVWSVNMEAEYHEEGAASSTTRGDRLAPTRLPAPTAAPIIPGRAVIEASFARLDPVAAGAAVGVVSGVALLVATAILLLKGGPVVGPNLQLLGQYFPGFDVTWNGMLLGLIEGGAGGFVLGYLVAWLRNRVMKMYAALARRRAEADARRDLLDTI